MPPEFHNLLDRRFYFLQIFFSGKQISTNGATTGRNTDRINPNKRCLATLPNSTNPRALDHVYFYCLLNICIFHRERQKLLGTPSSHTGNSTPDPAFRTFPSISALRWWLWSPHFSWRFAELLTGSWCVMAEKRKSSRNPRLRVVRRDDMGTLNLLKKAAVISRILDQCSVRY